MVHFCRCSLVQCWCISATPEALQKTEQKTEQKVILTNLWGPRTAGGTVAVDFGSNKKKQRHSGNLLWQLLSQLMVAMAAFWEPFLSFCCGNDNIFQQIAPQDHICCMEMKPDSPLYNRYITSTSTVHMWLNLREQFRKFRNHQYITSIIYHQYITSISPVHHQYITSASTVHMWLNLREQFRKLRNHQYITTISPVYHQYITSIPPVYHQYITSISPLYVK